MTGNFLENVNIIIHQILRAEEKGTRLLSFIGKKTFFFFLMVKVEKIEISLVDIEGKVARMICGQKIIFFFLN